MKRSNENYIHNSDSDSDDLKNDRENLIECEKPIETDIQFTIDDAVECLGIGLFHLNIFLFNCCISAADGMQFLFVAVVGTSIKCFWSLTDVQIAFITTIFFIGYALGILMFGPTIDRYGRISIIRLSRLPVLVIALLQTFAPSYIWLLVARIIVGFFICAAAQLNTYNIEMFPIRFRSSVSLLLSIPWSIGSVLEGFLAYLVLPSLGWRWLVLITGIPQAAVMVWILFIPETPRFLLHRGRDEEAMKVLYLASKLNRKSLPQGRLVLNLNENNGEYISLPFISYSRWFLSKLKAIAIKCYRYEGFTLFNKHHIFTTILLLLIWFTCAFSYYGAVLLTTDLFTYDNHCGVNNSNNSHIFNSSLVIRPTVTTSIETCDDIDLHSFIDFAITSFAELPGTLIALFLNEIIGRKLTLSFNFSIMAIFYSLLILCTGSNDRIVKVIFIFIIRGCVSASFTVAYIYTGEVFPTGIRATALSICSSVARIGAIVTPFFAQVLIRTHFLPAIIIYSSLAIVASTASVILPRETKGKRLATT